jgi:anti-sigma factor RsiW
MNIVQEFRSCPQMVLDRMVDGELGPDDRRALLAALDDEPGAWRQCALAFVEAQTFGWQLSRIANEPIVAQQTTPQAAPATRRRGWFAWPLTLAASVMVAFLVGRNLPAPSGKLPEVAGDAIQNTAAPETAIAGDGERRLTSVTLQPYGSEESIELPVIDSDDAAAANAAERSLAVSGALAQQFQRDGFEVDRQQQYWPVELPDGRSVLVPVEEMHIQSPEIQRL